MVSESKARHPDNQRPLVYRAEDESAWWRQGNHMGLVEIDVLVGDISDWAGIRKPVLKDGRGTRIARGRKESVSLPRFARNVSYVCHEMSHCIAAQRDMDDSHGPHFARIMLDVVRQFVSDDASKDLRYHFRERGVIVGRKSWRRVAA